MSRLGRNLRREKVKASNQPSFHAPLTHNLLLTKGQGSATFTRATTATVTDFEGLLKTAKAGEARFEGARRVENFAYTDPNQWTTLINGLVVSASGILAPDGTNTAYTLTATLAANNFRAQGISKAGKQTRASIWIRKRVLTGACFIYDTGDAFTATSVTSIITTSWQRITCDVQTQAGVNNLFGINLSTLGDSVDIWCGQVEDVTGQSNKNPSEYVSNGVLSSPWHGAGVDGVKYFNVYNGNTVTSKVVTEATGSNIPEATLKGVKIEVASTNLCLQSETFTTTWVPTTLTVTANTLVAPSGITTADTLTATAGNATLLQSITSASATRTFQIWLKRKTGSGNIDLTVDNGTTWTTKVINTTWTRYEISQAAVTNPVVGIRIVTNSDEVYAWGGQLESQPMATSYIQTTTASVVRNADVLTFPNAGNVSDTVGTVLMEATPAFDIPNSATIGYSSLYLMDFDGGAASGRITTANNTLYRYDGTTLIGSPAWTPLKNITYSIGSRHGSEGQRNFLNGTTGTNVAFDGSINSGANMTIGGYGGSTSYNWGGNIKNVKIWKRALSDIAIETLTPFSSEFSDEFQI